MLILVLKTFFNNHALDAQS